MNAEQHAAIEKIKKLLRMKRGGTPGEVENALALAAKLAREHGIDLDDVNPDDEQRERPITHGRDPVGSRVPQEMNYAASICINFFNVAIIFVRTQRTRVRTARWHGDTLHYRDRHAIEYIGTEWDIEVARYVFHFLIGHFRRSWRQRANKRLSNRQAFFHGMFIGLSNKPREAQPPLQPGTPGLVRVERAVAARKAYLEKLHPGAEDKPLPEEDSDAVAARTAGYIAGQNTNIRPALDGRNERGELLVQQKSH